MTSISSLLNTATGTCYILGNSSSLERVDLAGLAASRVPSIGVNRLLRVFRPVFLLLADKPVLAEEHPRLSTAKPRLLAWRGLTALLGSLAPGMDVRTWETWGGPFSRGWRPNRKVRWEPRWTRGAFWQTGNTGTYALEAAAMIGYRDLRMLGIDLRFDLPRSHFFGENVNLKGRRITYTAKQIKSVVQGYREVVEGLRGLGCRVTSESAYDGPLDAFIPRSEGPWQKTKP